MQSRRALDIKRVISARRQPHPHGLSFFFSSRRRHTSSVSAFLLTRSYDLRTSVFPARTRKVNANNSAALTACLIMEGAEFTENIINGVERPVKAAELFAFTLRVRAGNTDVLTDAEENVRVGKECRYRGSENH